MSQDPRALLQKAEKLQQSASGGFSLFGGKQNKLEEAADTFTQAANAFRLQKMGIEAGRAFERAANIQQNALKEADDAANTYSEAFKTYRKDSPEDAARCLQYSINHYTLKGNFRRAATNQQHLAELFEEIGDNKRALGAYDTAAGWFEQDNAEALANKLFLKTADIAALEHDYPRAIEYYEKVAKSSINNNLMKWSVKTYFLHAGMCHLATNDLVAVNRALENYREMDPSFASQREHQLLSDLAEAIERGDQEMFADKLFQYDSLSKLSKWETTILLRVKEQIVEKEEDFS
ncbi:TPR-like protein [Viridothelium virens]|uniref:TPR-like protein n=1 Tax=Viridothelium virens TaxID=1048519 RepID=A0A6A6HGI2_VIRVR|nr:TPR-like protein [Viridothelium virens]